MLSTICFGEQIGIVIVGVFEREWTSAIWSFDNPGQAIEPVISILFVEALRAAGLRDRSHLAFR